MCVVYVCLIWCVHTSACEALIIYSMGFDWTALHRFTICPIEKFFISFYRFIQRSALGAYLPVNWAHLFYHLWNHLLSFHFPGCSVHSFVLQQITCRNQHNICIEEIFPNSKCYKLFFFFFLHCMPYNKYVLSDILWMLEFNLSNSITEKCANTRFT